MKYVLFAGALAGILSACSQDSHVIDVQAHRGGAGLMPENTVQAMEYAINLGVNTLEFDLQLSADKKAVASHEHYFHHNYSTRPDGSPVMPEDDKEYLYLMPYDSIARYDVGLRPDSRWPGRKKLAAVKPLAEDIIDFAEAASSGKINYNIEIKSSSGEGEGVLWPDYKTFCDVCIPLLLSKNLGDRLIVQSFDIRTLEYIHENWPDVALSFLTGSEFTGISEALSQLSFTPEWWSPHYSLVSGENVKYCHERGIKVVPWTIDEPEDIKRIASLGVEAIISNYPDRVIEIVR